MPHHATAGMEGGSKDIGVRALSKLTIQCDTYGCSSHLDIVDKGVAPSAALDSDSVRGWCEVVL